jgi:hypothetical protein
MTIVDYVTVPTAGKAVQFTGSNADEIREFAGPAFVDACAGRVWVMTGDGPAELHPGWWAALEGEGESLLVYSATAFTRRVPGAASVTT